jgi:hypothetical protein
LPQSLDAKPVPTFAGFGFSCRKALTQNRFPLLRALLGVQKPLRSFRSMLDYPRPKTVPQTQRRSVSLRWNEAFSTLKPSGNAST